MAKGRVKWFNNAKGYGFIRPDMGGEDLFVHYTYIEMEGYKTLRAGQPVEYETLEAPKGHHAIKVLAHEEAGFDPNNEGNDGYEQHDGHHEHSATDNSSSETQRYQAPERAYSTHTQANIFVETV